MRKLIFRCWRCGYHYGARELVIEPGRLYPTCADVERCRRNIRTRNSDRVAAKGVRVLEP